MSPLTLRFTLVVVAAATTAACNRALKPPAIPRQSAFALTGGLNTSMIYFARTDAGIIAIDLGWWRHGGPVTRALESLGAKPADVTQIFVTHSHRDHVAAWPAFRHARFHVSDTERSRLTGDSTHRGWVPRAAERLKPSGLPDSATLDIQTFSADTIFVIGRDTLRAYLVPGHTAGSAVYLFREILFLGDAVSWTHARGFGPAHDIYSDDTEVADANLKNLWPRLPIEGVKFVCTAHGRCAKFNASFRAEVER